MLGKVHLIKRVFEGRVKYIIDIILKIFDIMNRYRFISLPFTIIFFFLFMFLLFLLPLIIGGAFRRLGFSPWITITLFFISLVGSAINIPVYTMKVRKPVTVTRPRFFMGFIYPETKKEYRVTKSTIAVNFGGALVPIFISLYLIFNFPNLLLHFIIGVGIISSISYYIAKPVPGVGITMPLFIPPILAAIIAFILPGGPATVIAYVSGVLGVLLGADILNLTKTAKLGSEVMSIGGAGTFDGIFLTGIVAVLLAA